MDANGKPADAPDRDRPAATASNESAASAAAAAPVSVILTVRLLMLGKEVGSIIGKRGDHIKLIRDRSAAKINISDGSCPERIVSITGSLCTINLAFQMIAQKFEEDMQAVPNSVPKPPITMRLIIPATQCGSIIGKGGAKIKEIRERTGASIQVASEMLPNSTERAVTISGTCEALVECMRQICAILQEAPPKGATLPFRPKPTYNPMLIASSAAAAAAAQQQATQHIASILQQHHHQHQQQQQQQQQLAAAQQQQATSLVQNVFAQSTPVYGMVNPVVSKLAYAQQAAQASDAELQQIILNNMALAHAQQLVASPEELQAALLGVNGHALQAAAWAGRADADLLNAQLLGQAGLLQQQMGGGKMQTGISESTQAHKLSGRANITLTNGTSANPSKRFAPY